MLKHCAGVCSQFWERQKSRGRECESNFEVGREQQKSRKRDRHRPGCFSVEQLCGSWKRSCDDILGHISYNTSENERGNTRYPGTQEGHRSCAQSVEQKKRHRCIEQSFKLVFKTFHSNHSLVRTSLSNFSARIVISLMYNSICDIKEGLSI